LIDEALESRAINIALSTQMESTAITFSSLKDQADKGIDILSQLLMHPLFAPDKVALARNLKIEELKRIGNDPQEFAFRALNRLLYRGNPRGRLSSVRSVENVTRDDLIQFHRRYFNPEHIMMAITGDISQRDAIQLIEKYFGSWRTQGIKGQIIIARQQLMLEFDNLPRTFLKDYPERIKKVTAEGVSKVVLVLGKSTALDHLPPSFGPVETLKAFND
jgi:predicted Zn-dependent peptidase